MLLKLYGRFLNGEVELSCVSNRECVGVVRALGIGNVTDELKNKISETKESVKTHLLQLKTTVEEGSNLQHMLQVEDPIREVVGVVSRHETDVKAAAE